MRAHPAIFAACLLVLTPGLALGAGVATGAYDNTLMIGYDPASGIVSGYFDMTQDGPPVVSCLFALQGKLAGAGAVVDTYPPDSRASDLIKGQLVMRSKTTLRLTLPSDHGGCGNVWGFSDKDNPSDFTLQTARPWTSVRVVKADKAYFYASAGATTHGRAYLVPWDGVGVLAGKPGWVQAEFVGGKRPISGWLRAADLY